MKVRACDKCNRIIRGPHHRVIPIGLKGSIRDICNPCMARLMMLPTNPPQPKKAPGHFFDIPLDTPGEDNAEQTPNTSKR